MTHNNMANPVMRISSNYLIVLTFSVVSLINFASGKPNEYVTCGSVLKLMNLNNRVRLHSHDVKYGTGSMQQSVTGTEITEDVNSHWTVKGDTNTQCKRGDPIKCGDVIRLEHLSTGKNLHSHIFSSPLSGNQEISAYGEKGVGDSGDHWRIICDSKYWERDDSVQLKHVDTDAYLSVSGRTYGRPIHGQVEIIGVTWEDSGTQWQAMEGLFIHKSDFDPKAGIRTHDPSEL